MSVQGPTVVRRQLGRRLRRLREEAGQTIASVAAARVFSTSKMIRVESGKIEVKAGDVWTLCRFYGMTDSTTIDELAELADGTGQRGWWQGTGLVDDRSTLFHGLEEGADEVLAWEPNIVSGLLQTAPYAQAVLSAVAGKGAVEKRVEFRMARQRQFFGRRVPLRVVLGPGTLLRELGGATTMQEQREHLLEISVQRRAEIRVLPWPVGIHAAMTAGFTVFRFDGDDNPSVVHQETLLGSRYLEEGHELQAYEGAFATLWSRSVLIEEHLS